MINNTNCLATLGVLTVALFATAFGAGCAANAAEKEPTGEAVTAITSSDMTVDGCSGTVEFDFRSDRQINYIAVDRSDFSDVKMKLFALDESGNETLVEEEAAEVDTAMQSMLDASSSHTNASQRSSNAAKDSASRRSTSTETESSDHDDSSDSYEDSKHTDDSKSASNNEGRDQHERDSAQSSNSSSSSDDDQDSSDNDSSSSSNSRESGSSAQNDASSKSESNTSTAGKKASETNSNSKTKTTTTSDSSDRAAESSDDSTSSNGSNAEHKSTSESSHSRTRHMVFKRLESMKSKHFVLRLEMKADESSESMRVFTGEKSKHVSSQKDFTGSFPQCGGGETGGDDTDSQQ